MDPGILRGGTGRVVSSRSRLNGRRAVDDTRSRIREGSSIRGTRKAAAGIFDRRGTRKWNGAHGSSELVFTLLRSTCSRCRGLELECTNGREGATLQTPCGKLGNADGRS